MLLSAELPLWLIQSFCHHSGGLKLVLPSHCVSLLKQSIGVTKLVPCCRDVSKAASGPKFVVNETRQCGDEWRRHERGRVVVSEARQYGDASNAGERPGLRNVKALQHGLRRTHLVPLLRILSAHPSLASPPCISPQTAPSSSRHQQICILLSKAYWLGRGI